MIPKEKYKRSLSYWKLGLKYLHFVEVTTEQVIDHGNNFIATWVGESTPEEASAELHKQTKWSDVQLIEPLIFNLYHGLELTLKGFAIIFENVPPKGSHKLSEYIQICKELFPDDTDVFDLADKYIDSQNMPELLREFFEINEASADDYYQLLRYPFDFKFTKKRDHFNLKYKGEAGLSFYQDLMGDLDKIARSSVILGRKLEEKSELAVGTDMYNAG